MSASSQATSAPCVAMKYHVREADISWSSSIIAIEKQNSLDFLWEKQSHRGIMAESHLLS